MVVPRNHRESDRPSRQARDEARREARKRRSEDGRRAVRSQRSRRSVSTARASNASSVSRASRPTRTSRTSRKRGISRLVIIGLVAALVVGAVIFAISHIDTKVHKEPGTVHFLAVGDNAPNEILGAYADAQAGETGDFKYDYHALFAPMVDYVQAADLAYVVQETHVGGILDGDIGPQGYPSFNTTDEMAQAIVDTGFDLVASATNHSYDWGNYGALEHSCEVWKRYDVAFTGTAATPEDAEVIPVVECNNIMFALLSYTYGLNSFTPEQIGEHKVNVYSEERLREDIPRAKEQADVVIVAMHWGTEYETAPDEEQLYYAQLLADLEADVVIGSHPHAIQPMTWLTSRTVHEDADDAENAKQSGEEAQPAEPHKTLVCYSLANYLMQYEDPPAITNLEGMMTCDFVREETDGPVTIQNIMWTPLVFHNESNNFAVWPVKDYTDDLAGRNYTYRKIENPRQWLIDQSIAVVNAFGDNFVIDYGQLEEETAQDSQKETPASG